MLTTHFVYSWIYLVIKKINLRFHSIFIIKISLNKLFLVCINFSSMLPKKVLKWEKCHYNLLIVFMKFKRSKYAKLYLFNFFIRRKSGKHVSWKSSKWMHIISELYTLNMISRGYDCIFFYFKLNVSFTL